MGEYFCRYKDKSDFVRVITQRLTENYTEKARKGIYPENKDISR